MRIAVDMGRLLAVGPVDDWCFDPTTGARKFHQRFEQRGMVVWQAPTDGGDERDHVLAFRVSG